MLNLLNEAVTAVLNLGFLIGSALLICIIIETIRLHKDDDDDAQDD
jgi:hypothetical protein